MKLTQLCIAFGAITLFLANTVIAQTPKPDNKYFGITLSAGRAPYHTTNHHIDFAYVDESPIKRQFAIKD